jgi:serine kinase of HPr protein (carbohydrate metabolism regulator)
LGNAAVLITGPPGSGKSDLALRLIDGGAKLVADDQILAEARGGHLFARAPQTIRGRMEVRHVGVLAVPFVEEAEIRLAIVLGEEAARLPEPAYSEVGGVVLPRLVIKAFEASAPAKIRSAVQALMAPPGVGVTFPFPPR